MTRKLNIRSLRLIGVGGAKAATKGQDVGDSIELDKKPYFA